MTIRRVPLITGPAVLTQAVRELRARVLAVGLHARQALAGGVGPLLLAVRHVPGVG